MRLDQREFCIEPLDQGQPAGLVALGGEMREQF